ncbi:MAG: enoyl-ACP reductase [Chloroflexi bacterium]|nr:enoyl-ACP reductase [Chloroflexota bacterium]
MYTIDLSGKSAIVFGVANHRSIAWAIAQQLHQAGARLAIAYQNERLRDAVEGLAKTLGDVLLLECDVSSDENVAATFSQAKERMGSLGVVVHSIAFAQREDMEGRFVDTGREGFRIALETSAYSLVPIARYAAPLMVEGGSIITITFQASERVYPGYNVMGVAKAALENEVRLLAAELGPQNIRVNAVSPGPVNTLAARGIHGFTEMRRVHAERAPLKRNVTQEEVARTALFLCSDMSSGVTGAVVPVDAGYHIMGV